MMAQVLAKSFANRFFDESAANLLVDQPRIFSDLPTANLQDLPLQKKKQILEAAERALSMPIPILLARDYATFHVDGNRSRYENAYFQRREKLYMLHLGAALDERYFLPMIDVLWAVLEESTWIVPAHRQHHTILPDCEEDHTQELDLCAAETGAELAMVLLLHRERLNAYAPTLVPRMERMLHRRVILPLMKEDDQFWKNGVNNWTPWILSNVYTILFQLPMTLEERRTVVQHTLPMLGKFVMTYHDDGGCDEGPTYWNVAVGSLIDCCELLYDLTDGQFDVFDDELLRRMAEYVAKAHIHDNYFLNFADASGRVYPNAPLIARTGKRIGSEVLEQFGRYMLAFSKKLLSNYYDCRTFYRAYKNLMTEISPLDTLRTWDRVWLDGLQVMALRQHPQSDKGFYLACKGGCNGENHNHNDVGTFVVYQNGQPLLPDLGVGTYCKATFDPALRYTIFSMQSSYHNLFEIGGTQQKPGGKYRASVVTLDDDSLTLELREAYPEECGIRSWKRYFGLTDGVVKIEDSFSLEVPKGIRFFLILLQKPQVDQGCLLLENTVITYDPSLQVQVEEIPFTDERFIDTWQTDRFYRVVLETGDPIQAGHFTLTLSER